MLVKHELVTQAQVTLTFQDPVLEPGKEYEIGWQLAAEQFNFSNKATGGTNAYCGTAPDGTNEGQIVATVPLHVMRVTSDRWVRVWLQEKDTSTPSDPAKAIDKTMQTFFIDLPD